MKKKFGIISLVCSIIALGFILWAVIGGQMGVSYGGLLLLCAVPFIGIGFILGTFARNSKQKFGRFAQTLSTIEMLFILLCIAGNM